MEKELINFEETNSPIPFIKVKHNNINFNLVIDSGCTISCIDNNILDLLIHTTTNEQTNGIIYADNTNEEQIPIVQIPITIGDVNYIEEFNAIDFSNMAKQVKESFGITIRGLLGSEFLYKHGLILDFNKHLIKYTDGNQTKLNFESSEQPETIDS